MRCDTKKAMLIVGTILVELGLLMLVKRKQLVNFQFFVQRPFSDAEQSNSLAKFNVMAGALFLLLLGSLFVLSGIGIL